MLRPILSVLGVGLLIVTLIDLLWTTLSVEGGAAPLTSRLMNGAWRGMRKLCSDGSWALVLSGPVILALSLAGWLAGLWAGWTLVFTADPQPIVDTVDGGSISWWDRAYFAGYAIFTLGNGDLVPQEGVWQIATTLATASGMLVVTLAVSYVLSVLGAVTQKRSFASSVAGLGNSGAEIVRTGWGGTAGAGLEGFLRTFSGRLNTLTANHKAYPILHYFHSHGADSAPAVAIVALDEALTLLRHGVRDGDGPSEAALASARASVTNYLSTLESAFVEPADETPPAPDLEGLREAQIPVVDEHAFSDAVDEHASRRRTLLGLARSDARQWPAD